MLTCHVENEVKEKWINSDVQNQSINQSIYLQKQAASETTVHRATVHQNQMNLYVECGS